MSFFGNFWDKIFPDNYNCIICGRELIEPNRYGTCSSCIVKMPFILSPCGKCGKEVNGEESFCSNCKGKKRSFDVAYSVFNYWGEGKKLIRGLKFGSKKYFAKYLVSYLVDLYIEKGINADLITYVPMHPKRKKRRGYDQAEVLATLLGERLNIPVKKCVERIKFHKEFARLSRKERKAWASTSFQSIEKLKGESVLVVDDVLTTGSSIEAVAELLHKNGAGLVIGFTVANTPRLAICNIKRRDFEEKSLLDDTSD